MNGPLIIAIGSIVGGLLASTAPQHTPPDTMSNKNIKKVHECHDKGQLVAVTRDDQGEYVTCNKTWPEWKKYIKKLKEQHK